MRRGALREAGEVADVEEEDRDLDLLARQHRALGQDPVGELRIDVAAERVVQALALLQAARPSG